MNKVINDGGLYGSICIAVARIEALLLSLIRKRGLGTAYKLTGQILRNSPMCRAEISPGGWMALSVLDPYWGPVAVGGRDYEPEIGSLLRRVAPQLENWGFLDCGANFGYWSAFVAALNIGCRSVAAVELNPLTYAWLVETARLNGGFATFNSAVSGRTGEAVYVENADSHAISHVGRSGIPMITRSIDDIVGSLDWTDIEALIIKLDIEGYEPQAILGARETRNAFPNHLIIYEDHGSDRDCENTRMLMGEGYAVCFICKDGSTVNIEHWSKARDLKTNFGRGYNFAATVPGTDLSTMIR